MFTLFALCSLTRLISDSDQNRGYNRAMKSALARAGSMSKLHGPRTIRNPEESPQRQTPKTVTFGKTDEVIQYDVMTPELSHEYWDQISLQSCDSDLGDRGTDPNRPLPTLPKFVIPPSLLSNGPSSPAMVPRRRTLMGSPIPDDDEFDFNDEARGEPEDADAEALHRLEVELPDPIRSPEMPVLDTPSMSTRIDAILASGSGMSPSLSGSAWHRRTDSQMSEASEASAPYLPLRSPQKYKPEEDEVGAAEWRASAAALARQDSLQDDQRHPPTVKISETALPSPAQLDRTYSKRRKELETMLDPRTGGVAAHAVPTIQEEAEEPESVGEVNQEEPQQSAAAREVPLRDADEAASRPKHSARSPLLRSSPARENADIPLLSEESKFVAAHPAIPQSASDVLQNDFDFGDDSFWEDGYVRALQDESVERYSDSETLNDGDGSTTLGISGEPAAQYAAGLSPALPDLSDEDFDESQAVEEEPADQNYTNALAIESGKYWDEEHEAPATLPAHSSTTARFTGADPSERESSSPASPMPVNTAYPSPDAIQDERTNAGNLGFESEEAPEASDSVLNPRPSFAYQTVVPTLPTLPTFPELSASPSVHKFQNHELASPSAYHMADSHNGRTLPGLDSLASNLNYLDAEETHARGHGLNRESEGSIPDFLDGSSISDSTSATEPTQGVSSDSQPSSGSAILPERNMPPATMEEHHSAPARLQVLPWDPFAASPVRESATVEHPSPHQRPAVADLHGWNPQAHQNSPLPEIEGQRSSAAIPASLEYDSHSSLHEEDQATPEDELPEALKLDLADNGSLNRDLQELLLSNSRDSRESDPSNTDFKYGSLPYPRQQLGELSSMSSLETSVIKDGIPVANDFRDNPTADPSSSSFSSSSSPAIATGPLIAPRSPREETVESALGNSQVQQPSLSTTLSPVSFSPFVAFMSSPPATPVAPMGEAVKEPTHFPSSARIDELVSTPTASDHELGHQLMASPSSFTESSSMKAKSQEPEEDTDHRPVEGTQPALDSDLSDFDLSPQLPDEALDEPVNDEDAATPSILEQHSVWESVNTLSPKSFSPSERSPSERSAPTSPTIEAEATTTLEGVAAQREVVEHTIHAPEKELSVEPTFTDRSSHASQPSISDVSLREPSFGESMSSTLQRVLSQSETADVSVSRSYTLRESDSYVIATSPVRRQRTSQGFEVIRDGSGAAYHTQLAIPRNRPLPSEAVMPFPNGGHGQNGGSVMEGEGRIPSAISRTEPSMFSLNTHSGAVSQSASALSGFSSSSNDVLSTRSSGEIKLGPYAGPGRSENKGRLNSVQGERKLQPILEPTLSDVEDSMMVSTEAQPDLALGREAGPTTVVAAHIGAPTEAPSEDIPWKPGHITTMAHVPVSPDVEVQQASSHHPVVFPSGVLYLVVKSISFNKTLPSDTMMTLTIDNGVHSIQSRARALPEIDSFDEEYRIGVHDAPLSIVIRLSTPRGPMKVPGLDVMPDGSVAKLQMGSIKTEAFGARRELTMRGLNEWASGQLSGQPVCTAHVSALYVPYISHREQLPGRLADVSSRLAAARAELKAKKPRMQGALRQYGGDIARHHGKERWFVLDPVSPLLVAHSVRSRKARTLINLSKATDVSQDATGSIEIHFRNHEGLKFQANTVSSLGEWLAALKDAVEPPQAPRPRWIDAVLYEERASVAAM